MIKETNYRKIIYIMLTISIIMIVLIGITYAYFAEATSSSTNEITSTENLNINYSENKDYMFSGLIPSTLENALIGASKVENKCMDDNNNYVCSLYEFTVDNISNVSQDIEVYLYQQINGYTNLKYEVYETSINDSNFDNEHKVVNSTSLVYTDSQNELGTKIDGLTKTLTRLDNGTTTDSVTYTILFYVENQDYNQSEYDGGKQIIADIHVESKVSDSLPSIIKTINIPEKVGVLKTGVKYYQEGSMIDYIVIYDKYIIIKCDSLNALVPTFLGFYKDNDDYYVTYLEDSIPIIPLNINLNGVAESFTVMGITFNISNNTMPITWDKEKEIFTNVIYYMDDFSDFCQTNSYYYTLGFINDNDSITFVESNAECSNNLVNASEDVAYDKSRYMFTNDGRSIIVLSGDIEGHTYSIRES